MRASLKKIPICAAALSFAAVAPLSAAPLPITVVNAGFENPVLGDGDSRSSVFGWTTLGDITLFAAWNPTAAFYASGAPEGENIGDIFLSDAFSGCSQILQGSDGQFQADTTYELKVKVGRNLLDPYDGYIIQLLVDGIVIAQDDNSRIPAAGSFVSTSVKYIYNADLHASLVGFPIEIRLLSKGLGGGAGDINFDDVQFTYETSNPVAKHGGPYRLTQGAPLSLNASASLPSPGAAITSYEWDLNSNDNGGVFNADFTTATVNNIPFTTLTTTYGMVFGANTIRLRITDNAAKTITGSTTVTLFPLYTYTGPNTSRGQDERWNVPGNWSSAAVPSGLVDVLVPASKFVPCLSATTPTYTGNLTIGANSQISIGWTTSSSVAANSLGKPGSTVITMDSGSSINFRIGGTPIIPGIALNGNASVTLGSSTQTGAQASFNHPITGNHRLSFFGNSTQNCVANLNAPNTFNEIYTAGAPYVDGGVTIRGNAPGSLGTGNLTLTALGGGGNSGVVVINAPNAMADSATLSMDGNTAVKITMNANDTISRLVINGTQLPAGTYGSSTSSATFKQTWMAGTAVLTVTDGEGRFWDNNGATAGAGGASPSGTWNTALSTWSASTTGTTATASWVAGGSAVFAAGSDATGPYTVTVGDPNGITISNSFTASANTGTSSFNVTRSGWALNGGNCVAVMISSLNAQGFTATYAGQPMVVQGVFEARNSYTGIAYIIGDSLPATGDVVISVPRVVAAINTGGYANMGTVYSILSLSGVASAGTAVTRVHVGTPPVTTSLSYSTSVNNSFVLGIASDSNWQNQLKTVVGTCSDVITTAKPAYYNTVQCSGFVTAAGSYTDVYSNRPAALITLPFNAKTDSNPLLGGAGQKIGGLAFEEGTVTITGSKLELQTTSFFDTASGVTPTIASQISGLPSAGLTKRGLGSLILSNATNNYTGPTRIRNGILRLGASNTLPATAVTIDGDSPGVTASLDLNGFSNTLPGLSLGGSSSTSGSAITTGAGILTLSGNVDYASDNNPLGATISGNLALGSSPVIFNIEDSSTAFDDLTVSATISGTGGLSKAGFGTLHLTGNLTHTGATSVSGGMLVLSGSNNSAATGGITVNNNGAVRFDAPGSINGTGQSVTIDSGGVAYFGASFGANIPAAMARINPASEGVIAVDNFSTTPFDFSTNSLNAYLGAMADITYTGTISPNGGTYRIGGGTGTITLGLADALTGAGNLLVGGRVVIANANGFSGATTITSAGRLQIGAGGALGSLSSSTSITNDGTLAFKRSDTFTQGTDFWATISGTGRVEHSGSGVLVLNGNNTYGGGTNLVSGTLKLGHENAIGSGSLAVYSGTLDAVGPDALTLTSANAITLGGNFSFGGTANLNMGNGSISNSGNRTVTLIGSNKKITFGGVMTNISGTDQTLTVNGAGNTLSFGGYNMSSDFLGANIALTIGGTGNVDITGTIDDGSLDENDVRLGSLTKTGTGTLTLYGNNNYSGDTVIAGGVLHLVSGTQASPISVNNGGKLAFTLGATFNARTIVSTNRLKLNPGHKIQIIGTVDIAVPYYTLMAASSITGGMPELDTLMPGLDPLIGTTYALEIADNELRLSKVDSTAPVLTGADIVDDKGGASIPPNTPVTYTVTFNEDIDETTVTSEDFVNAGGSTVSIGTITETSPGIFTVLVTPTTAGTLRLSIPQGAIINDLANNALNTASPILDDTTIIVALPSTNWLIGSDIEDDRGGEPIARNSLITYTLYFDQDIDHLTVTAADFNNAGNSIITIGAITEIAPGTFTVQVTPTTTGSVQLRIPNTADIRNPANAILDVDPAIVDDTTIIVQEPYGFWADGNAFNDDTNGDGVANGLAWLLGASEVNQDARRLLPTTDEVSGDLYVDFITLDTTSRGAASIKVQYSKDLGVADLWTAHQAEVPDTTGIVNGIDFDILPLGDGYIHVVARIPSSAAGSGKKLFGRVSATAAP